MQEPELPILISQAGAIRVEALGYTAPIDVMPLRIVRDEDARWILEGYQYPAMPLVRLPLASITRWETAPGWLRSLCWALVQEAGHRDLLERWEGRDDLADARLEGRISAAEDLLEVAQTGQRIITGNLSVREAQEAIVGLREALLDVSHTLKHGQQCRWSALYGECVGFTAGDLNKMTATVDKALACEPEEPACE